MSSQPGKLGQHISKHTESQPSKLAGFLETPSKIGHRAQRPRKKFTISETIRPATRPHRLQVLVRALTRNALKTNRKIQICTSGFGSALVWLSGAAACAFVEPLSPKGPSSGARSSPKRVGSGGFWGETFRSTSKPVFVESYPMWGARDGVRWGPETDQGLSLLVPGVRKEWLRNMDTPGLTSFLGLSTGYPFFKDTSTCSVSSNDCCPV